MANSFEGLRRSIVEKSKQLKMPHQLVWYKSTEGQAVMVRYPGAAQRDLEKIVKHVAFDLPNDEWVVDIKPGPKESRLLAYHSKQSLEDVFDEMIERGHLKENHREE